MAVKFLGADRIGHYEDVILQTVADGIHAVWPEKQPSTEEEAVEAAKEEEEKKKLKEEEAVAKKRDEASMFLLRFSWKLLKATNRQTRHMDPAGSCVCNPQESDFHSGAFDCRHHAQGREGAEGLGCRHRETKALADLPPRCSNRQPLHLSLIQLPT